MTDKPALPDRLSLSRWSRRKREASVAQTEAKAAPVGSASSARAPSVPSEPPVPSAGSPGAGSASAQLPSIDSLGFDSDFTAFLRPEVDETLKRAALKQLFRDPRFNVMDGLDTYIDDYTKADPIEPDVLADLLRRGFGPPPGTDAQAVAASSDAAPATVAPTAAGASSPPETSSESALSVDNQSGNDAEADNARSAPAADDRRGGR